MVFFYFWYSVNWFKESNYCFSYVIDIIVCKINKWKNKFGVKFGIYIEK